MATTDFDIVVIGGGSGGLVVAAGGATLGAKVALVENHKLGGDCLWTGCVPSKTLIKSARVAYLVRNADRFALSPHDPKPAVSRVMEHVASVIAGIEPNDSPERFRALGVDVIFGNGRFIDPETFEVDGRRLRARTFVIATGSRPAIPSIPGIESVPCLTNETIFNLREDVPHLIVVGSGPIGNEMAQAFRRLGSDVTVVDIAPVILPREDADLAAIVFRQLQSEGVRYRLSASIAKVENTPCGIRLLLRAPDGTAQPLDATHLLLAAGRKANIENLGLDAARRPRVGRSHCSRERTDDDESADLRDWRRGRRPPIHPSRGAPRRHCATPYDLQAQVDQAFHRPPMVHIHRSRIRARRYFGNGSEQDRHRSPYLHVSARRHRSCAGRRRDPRNGQGGDDAARKGAGRRDRRATRGRTDRRICPRDRQWHESERHFGIDPRLSDVRANQSPCG
jgi:NADH dehydrogenase FAD-containing subunit